MSSCELILAPGPPPRPARVRLSRARPGGQWLPGDVLTATIDLDCCEVAPLPARTRNTLITAHEHQSPRLQPTNANHPAYSPRTRASRPPGLQPAHPPRPRSCLLGILKLLFNTGRVSPQRRATGRGVRGAAAAPGRGVLPGRHAHALAGAPAPPRFHPGFYRAPRLARPHPPLHPSFTRAASRAPSARRPPNRHTPCERSVRAPPACPARTPAQAQRARPALVQAATVNLGRRPPRFGHPRGGRPLSPAPSSAARATARYLAVSIARVRAPPPAPLLHAVHKLVGWFGRGV
jgi:hypothetical protein